MGNNNSQPAAVEQTPPQEGLRVTSHDIDWDDMGSLASVSVALDRLSVTSARSGASSTRNGTGPSPLLRSLVRRSMEGSLARSSVPSAPHSMRSSANGGAAGASAAAAACRSQLLQALDPACPDVDRRVHMLDNMEFQDLEPEHRIQFLEEERMMLAERLLAADALIADLDRNLRQLSGTHESTRALLHQLLEEQQQQQRPEHSAESAAAAVAMAPRSGLPVIPEADPLQDPAVGSDDADDCGKAAVKAIVNAAFASVLAPAAVPLVQVSASSGDEEDDEPEALAADLAPLQPAPEASPAAEDSCAAVKALVAAAFASAAAQAHDDAEPGTAGAAGPADNDAMVAFNELVAAAFAALREVETEAGPADQDGVAGPADEDTAAVVHGTVSKAFAEVVAQAAAAADLAPVVDDDDREVAVRAAVDAAFASVLLARAASGTFQAEVAGSVAPGPEDTEALVKDTVTAAFAAVVSRHAAAPPAVVELARLVDEGSEADVKALVAAAFAAVSARQLSEQAAAAGQEDAAVSETVRALVAAVFAEVTAVIDQEEGEREAGPVGAVSAAAVAGPADDEDVEGVVKAVVRAAFAAIAARSCAEAADAEDKGVVAEIIAAVFGNVRAADATDAAPRFPAAGGARASARTQATAPLVSAFSAAAGSPPTTPWAGASEEAGEPLMPSVSVREIAARLSAAASPAARGTPNVPLPTPAQIKQMADRYLCSLEQQQAAGRDSAVARTFSLETARGHSFQAAQAGEEARASPQVPAPALDCKDSARDMDSPLDLIKAVATPAAAKQAGSQRRGSCQDPLSAAAVLDSEASRAGAARANSSSSSGSCGSADRASSAADTCVALTVSMSVPADAAVPVKGVPTVSEEPEVTPRQAPMAAAAASPEVSPASRKTTRTPSFMARLFSCLGEPMH